MKQQQIREKIENSFRERARKDKKVKNAYLLVQSDKLGISLNIAEGSTGDMPAHPSQPNHMASVGKLFTSTLISILYEKGRLDFDDSIARHLDPELMDGLHVYKGRDYSADITVRHLLMQTSGLSDVFFIMWEKMAKDPEFRISPREAVIWGKKNLKPAAVPGKKHLYTDTNYYLLGLIVESITGKKFHQVMHEYIFDPLGMEHAYMHGISRPKREPEYPAAKLNIKDTDVDSLKWVYEIDYAGGSVVAPLEEFLTFIRALRTQKLIKTETLNRMISDDVKMGLPAIGFNYGYSIWKMMPVPLIMPKKFSCWGCVGVTGAFMFYHPETDSYIIGTFNDFSYRSKALQFMVRKVIKELLKLK